LQHHSVLFYHAHDLERPQLSIVFADRNVFARLEGVLIETIAAFVGLLRAMDIVMKGPRSSRLADNMAYFILLAFPKALDPAPLASRFQSSTLMWPSSSMGAMKS